MRWYTKGASGFHGMDRLLSKSDEFNGCINPCRTGGSESSRQKFFPHMR
jgi:hypothetical protein